MGQRSEGVCQLRLPFEQTFLEAPPSNFRFSLIGQGWILWPHLDQSLEDDGEGGVAACPISHMPEGLGNTKPGLLGWKAPPGSLFRGLADSACTPLVPGTAL